MRQLSRLLKLAIISTLLCLPATTFAAEATCKTTKDCKSGTVCVKGQCIVPQSADPTEDELRAVGLDPNATSLDPRKSGSPTPAAAATTTTPAPTPTPEAEPASSPETKTLQPADTTDSSPPSQEASPSDEASEGVGFAAQSFLIQDKVSAGARFSFIEERFGFQASFNLLYVTNNEPAGVLDGDFLAGVFELHLLFNALEIAGLQIRTGLGVDLFGVWGIKSDKYEVGLPFLAEVNYEVLDGVSIFLQPRYYLITTDGLENGIDRKGDKYLPILLTTGIEFAL